MCLLQYNGKIKHIYRICIILETFPSEENLVRTVKVGFRPKRQCKPGPYKSVSIDELVVGVPRLVLIVPAEELSQAHNSLVLKLGPHSDPSFNPGERGGGLQGDCRNSLCLPGNPTLSLGGVVGEE